jgi:hypothetical protein
MYRAFCTTHILLSGCCAVQHASHHVTAGVTGGLGGSKQGHAGGWAGARVVDLLAKAVCSSWRKWAPQLVGCLGQVCLQAHHLQ